MKRHFSNEEVQIANKYMKKMFNIFSHEENVNQNYIEIPCHVVRMAIIKKENKC
jgi:hypothetical protein